MILFYNSVLAIILCFVIIIYTKFFLKKNFLKTSLNSSLTELLKQIRKSQLYPISAATGWQLIHSGGLHRLWQRTLTAGKSKQITVTGCFTRICASPQVVLNHIRDTALISGWMCDVVMRSSTPVPNDLPENLLLKNSKHDQLYLNIVKAKSLVDWITLLLSAKTIVYRRISLEEDNGCCWILLYNVTNHSWYFILSQPIEDVGRSMLTVIEYNSAVMSSPGRTAQEYLMSLCDLLYHRKNMVTPLLPSDNSTLHFKMLPKRSRSFRPGKKNSFAENKFDYHNASSESSILSKQNGRSADSLIQEEIIHRKLDPGPCVSSPAIVLSHEDCPTAEQHVESDYGITNYSDISHLESDGLSTDEKFSNIDAGDTENILNCLLSSPNMDSSTLSAESAVALKHLHFECNRSAAELYSLALEASNINLDLESSSSRNAKDWAFCTVDQDVVVMKRSYTCNNSKVLSYLGKGLIELSPSLVWDTVRNPRMRFAYDETLKRVDVISQIDDSVKIICYYHEVISLFHKESCEFHLAQKERQDNEHYLLSTQSCNIVTNQPKKFSVLPSGWFIEKVIKDGQLCSVVTYIAQVEFPSKTRAKVVNIMEELMSKQPLAIVQLRNYLKPYNSFVSP